MITPVTISLGGVPGLSGQAILPAKEVLDLTLTASTTKLAVPLPTGITTPNFVAVFAAGVHDLTVQWSDDAHAKAVPVPFGATMLFYGVATVYLNSSIGGACQVVVG